MWGDVDVVRVARVHVDDMEAHAGAIDDLQPLAFLHREVNQLGTVLQLREWLKGRRKRTGRRISEAGGGEKMEGDDESRRKTGGCIREVRASLCFQTLKAMNLW